MSARLDVRMALVRDGHGWFRTSDLSRVKRATARIRANRGDPNGFAIPNPAAASSSLRKEVFAKCST